MQLKEPNDQSFFLDVPNGHSLHVADFGNRKGIPIVFLHGGPGGGCQPSHRTFFDPSKFRVIFIDQRGCGKSTPFASLENNTTWDLVADIELVRKHLQIEKWHIFGGSWGSTLALCYAIKHPSIALSLILRGIFLCRQKEIDWFYQEGASRLFPDLWQDYLKPIALSERKNLVAAYHKLLTSTDIKVQSQAALSWSIWEAATSKLERDQQSIAEYQDPLKFLPFARIENHYFVNRAFLKSDNWILDNCQNLKMPIQVVHGRYDVVCPIESAWDLKKQLPHIEFVIAEKSGHSPFEKEIFSTLQHFLSQLT